MEREDLAHLLCIALGVRGTRTPAASRYAVKNIVPVYQKHCENNLQNSIVVGWLQYFGYNAHCTKGEGDGEGTIIAYNAIVKIIYNP